MFILHYYFNLLQTHWHKNYECEIHYSNFGMNCQSLVTIAGKGLKKNRSYKTLLKRNFIVSIYMIQIYTVDLISLNTKRLKDIRIS